MQFGILQPSQELLDTLREADEEAGTVHDIGWDGTIVIDNSNIIYWMFVDSHETTFAARMNYESRTLEIISAPLVQCKNGHEHLASFLRERIGPEIALFISEGGPAFHEED